MYDSESFDIWALLSMEIWPFLQDGERVTDLVSRRSIHAPYPKTLARHPTRPRFVQRRRRTDGRAGGGAGGGDDGLGLPGLSERKDAPTAGEVLLRRRISGLGAAPAMRE